MLCTHFETKARQDTQDNMTRTDDPYECRYKTLNETPADCTQQRVRGPEHGGLSVQSPST